MCKKDILQYYIDAREILRFPNEIKTGISPSEMKIFILLFEHSTDVVTIKDII